MRTLCRIEPITDGTFESFEAELGGEADDESLVFDRRLWEDFEGSFANQLGKRGVGGKIWVNVFKRSEKGDLLVWVGKDA